MTAESSQQSSVCSRTSDWRKRMQRSGSSPAASRIAVGVVDALAQLRRVVGDRDRVQVDDAVDRLAVAGAVLALDVLADRADVVAEVLAPGRLDAAEDPHRRNPDGARDGAGLELLRGPAALAGRRGWTGPGWGLRSAGRSRVAHQGEGDRPAEQHQPGSDQHPEVKRRLRGGDDLGAEGLRLRPGDVADVAAGQRLAPSRHRSPPAPARRSRGR